MLLLTKSTRVTAESGYRLIVIRSGFVNYVNYVITLPEGAKDENVK
jgi:hypothetical protein